MISALGLESQQCRRYQCLAVTTGSVLGGCFFLLRIPVVSAGFQLLIQAAISLASAARELGCEQGVACCQPLACCDHHAAQPLLLPSVSSVVSVKGELK